MRSQDFYWTLLLVASLVFLAFLSFNFGKVLSFQEESSSLALPVSPSSTSSPGLEEIEEQGLFLVSYPEGDLVSFRDLFHPAIPIAEEIEEGMVAVLPEEYGEEVVYVPPQEFVSPQEEEVEEEYLPPVHLQGVVVSDSRQAVIVEVGGKIQILTNEKNLSSNIKLVKVEGKEVVLNYEGREITLTFEK
ncbi:MAG TPA: hypothetical protein PK844_03385 [Candidatus Atribacteria bacterium]|mgnify:CR=1 FL=1|nr:hypothetical protein [Candidatus Atribacteria bacterium]